ncbi:hypothetical protein EII34_04465 [Arachnia propionica]|uniref:Uncharacterized protein n=1 Tax=Arachnia propionica TaxID=1750 RepID=A0A3P1T9T7_9ACTN|nr:hypothetical protein [Arachnia propionica]RRD05945.1 hypothetical protein EII34_04465 [Arachnia propionica]
MRLPTEGIEYSAPVVRTEGSTVTVTVKAAAKSGFKIDENALPEGWSVVGGEIVFTWTGQAAPCAKADPDADSEHACSEPVDADSERTCSEPVDPDSEHTRSQQARKAGQADAAEAVPGEAGAAEDRRLSLRP